MKINSTRIGLISFACFTLFISAPGFVSPALESIQVIPTNSSLYIADFDNSALEELPATYFRNHVGDLLVEQSVEGLVSSGFFIIHWNAEGSNFVTTQVPMLGNSLGGHLEGTTFAPVQFPIQ